MTTDHWPLTTIKTTTTSTITLTMIICQKCDSRAVLHSCDVFFSTYSHFRTELQLPCVSLSESLSSKPAHRYEVPHIFIFSRPSYVFCSQASQLIWGPSYLQPRPSYAFHQKLWCIGGCSPHCCPLWSHHPGCSLLQVHSLTFIFLRSKPKEGLCLRKYQSFGFLQMGGFHFGNCYYIKSNQL